MFLFRFPYKISLALLLSLVILIAPMPRAQMVQANGDSVPSSPQAMLAIAPSGPAPKEVVQFAGQLINKLSGRKPFTDWQGASPEFQPLGPGMHAWLVTLTRDSQPVGYLIIGARPSGGYALIEYGAGPEPLFDTAALQRALAAENGRSAQTDSLQGLQVEHLYAGPLLAEWRIVNRGIRANGEQTLIAQTISNQAPSSQTKNKQTLNSQITDGKATNVQAIGGQDMDRYAKDGQDMGRQAANAHAIVGQARNTQAQAMDGLASSGQAVGVHAIIAQAKGGHARNTQAQVIDRHTASGHAMVEAIDMQDKSIQTQGVLAQAIPSDVLSLQYRDARNADPLPDNELVWQKLLSAPLQLSSAIIASDGADTAVPEPPTITAASFDPNDNLLWLTGDDLKLTASSLVQELRQHKSLIFAARSEERNYTLPLPVYGYQIWEQGQNAADDQVYVMTGTSSSPRFIAFSELAKAGQFYSSTGQ